MNSLSTPIAWPPEYKIKKHKMARNVKLRAAHSRGLVITVPMRFNIKEIPDILERNKDWITKQLLRVQTSYSDELPDSIEMKAMNESWIVAYVACQTKLNIIERPHQEMALVGDIHQKELCKAKLVHWLKLKAKHYLSTQLKALSEETKLYYTGLTIREQQTVWGSCTASKAINLNYKLIFLPPQLARHVLVHELCHIKHLNHSDRFWRLVASFDEQWETHRRELRRADEFVPAWLK